MRDRFVAPRRVTKEERGHQPTCVYTTNHGQSCNCDGLLGSLAEAALGRRRINEAMALGGWTLEDGTGAWAVYRMSIGRHRITVARVHGGWSVIWTRGTGLTLLEEVGFGTIEVALKVLWQHEIEARDLGIEQLAELTRYRLAETATEPRPTLTSVPMPTDTPE